MDEEDPRGGSEIGPVTRSALEYGPVLLFFATYLLLKDRTFSVGNEEYSGFVVATAIFIPAILGCIAAHWFLARTVSRMQAATAVLVVVFGGMSIWFNDERFFKIKPTVIYLLFAGIMAGGMLFGKSMIRAVMGEVLPLNEQGWRVMTRNCTILFFVLAAVNEAVWRSFSTETWVYFKTFGIPGAMFAFLFLQTALLIWKYGEDDGEDGSRKAE